MCLMCVEFIKSRMTYLEAKRALPELIDTAKNEEERDHYLRLSNANDEEHLKEIIEKEEEKKVR